MELTIWNQIWIACALLHRAHPERPSFTQSEIIAKLRDLKLEPEVSKQALWAHLGGHCLAIKKADPARLRILHKEADGTLRLFRPGDPEHPERRSGRIAPVEDKLPPKYRELLNWYRGEYCAGLAGSEADSILALRGVGKQVWRELGGGDEFIRRIRGDWFGAPEAPATAPERELTPAGERP